MEQDRARGPGRPYNGAPGELRRPHYVPGIDGNSSYSTARAVDNTHNSAPPSNVMPTSMSSTSADMVPTVPKTEHMPYEYAFSAEAVNVPVKPHPNSRLDPHINETVKNSKLSPLAKEFVPKTFVQGDAPAPSGTSVPSQLEYMVCLVQEFIYEVTLNPGKFDEEVLLLTETLSVIARTAELTKALVEIIFKQAINEPNFRYNGARLCSHLNRNLVSDVKVHNFRYFLLEKCQFEYNQRAVLIKNNPPYLRGLVFFFGELYSQILQPDGSRLDSVRDAIINFLNTLLIEPTSDDIKCVCQVIKMTGANLDDDERPLRSQNNNQPERIWLSNIFERLKEVNNHPDLSAMVSNVLHLKDIDWGRSSNPSQTQQPLPPQAFPEGAVFYGPDGQPITSEEALFLEYEAYNDCGLEYDEVFNDEIAADYETFLREMGQ